MGAGVILAAGLALAGPPAAGGAEPPGTIVVAQVEAPTGPLRPPTPPQPSRSETPSPQPTGPTTPSPRERWPKPEIDLNQLETKDLSLLYFDPSETYLTPYIARSFTNSL